MTDNKVYALLYGSPQGFFGAAPDIKGLFTTRELAEKRLLETVLDGIAIIGARIEELTVEQEFDPRNPVNYPEVIASLIEFKKIQAIKHMREKVDGLSLKEAKDAVEAVKLNELPQATLDAAQAVLENRRAEAVREAEEKVEAERQRARQEAAPGERFEPTEDWLHSNWLIDEDGDAWGHIGDGMYVLVNCYGVRDNWGSAQSEADVDENYVIVKHTEDRPEFDNRF